VRQLVSFGDCFVQFGRQDKGLASRFDEFVGQAITFDCRFEGLVGTFHHPD